MDLKKKKSVFCELLINTEKYLERLPVYLMYLASVLQFLVDVSEAAESGAHMKGLSCCYGANRKTPPPPPP